jgi:excisionase family DNA binding protein
METAKPHLKLTGETTERVATLIPMFMTIPEVCHEAHVGRSFVFERINRGDLEATKFGRATRIKRSEFERWLGTFPTTRG